MKRTQPGVVLRAGFAQLDVLAHNTDDVGLLLDGVRKIAGLGHERKCRRYAARVFILCLTPGLRPGLTQMLPLRGSTLARNGCSICPARQAVRGPRRQSGSER